MGGERVEQSRWMVRGCGGEGIPRSRDRPSSFEDEKKKGGGFSSSSMGEKN